MNNSFKYKKRFLGVIACLSVAVFTYGQKIDSLVIKYVDMWSENTANVSCCDFVELYKDANKVVVTDSIEIDRFMDALKSLSRGKVRRSRFTVQMDTRAQIYIYRNNCNCTTVACLELLGLIIGNDYFTYSADFLRVLEQYILKEYLPHNKTSSKHYK